jgi:hypothetical protein
MTNATVKNAQTFETPPVISLASAVAGTLPITANALPVPNITYTGSVAAGFWGTVSYKQTVTTSGVSAPILALDLNFAGENELLTLDLGNVAFLSTFLVTTALQLNTISGPNVVTSLASIGGTLDALTSLSLPNMVTAGSIILSSTSLTTHSYPSLVNMLGNFGGTLPALTTVSVPNLVSIGNSFNGTFATITTLNFPSLVTLGSAFPTLAACTSLLLPSLQVVGGAFSLTAASLTTLSLPAIVTFDSTFAITAANMTTFSMGSTLKRIGGNFTMSFMALNVASVNGILVSLAALDGTNGTTAYSSKTINIGGGTSAAPTGAGATAKTTLQGRGCTVTTN